MNLLLPGQYPRGEKLVAATRNFDRKRITLQELETIAQEDLQSFLKLQTKMEFRSSGLFNWQDLLRPFTEIIEHSHAEALNRFYETNTFWRLLECGEKPRLKDFGIERWTMKYFFADGELSTDEPVLFTLPFLYLFKDYSAGIPLEWISHLLETIAAKLLTHPRSLLCFFEPTFGWRKLSPEEKKQGVKLLEAIKTHSPSPVYIYSSFFDISQDLDFIYSLPVDGIGIDFYANSLANVMDTFPQDKTLLAGIINTVSTLIEPRNTVEQFLKLLHPYISEQQVQFIPNGPSELLPRAIMDQKVKNLQEIILCLPQPS